MCVLGLQLWSGAVNYPDFFAKQTQKWWEEQIQAFNKNIPLDGIWIDMNEADNYCSGDICYDGRLQMFLKDCCISCTCDESSMTLHCVLLRHTSDICETMAVIYLQKARSDLVLLEFVA